MLEACLEDTRQLYNAALEERREAWRRGVSVTYKMQSAQIKDIRAADPEGVGRWAFACERAAIRRLDRAFQAFFRRCKAGEKPGYPRFKGCGRWNSIEWQADNGARWDTVAHPTVTRVYFGGMGHVRVHQHRAIRGRIKTITVKREAGRWYVVLSCDNVSAEPLSPTGAVVGIDMGTVHFLATSDGKKVPNPRPEVAVADQLAATHRSISRKRRGSNRRRKAVRKLGTLSAKVRRSRRDHAHKTALALVRDHDVIVHEDLNIAGMTRRPKPKLAEDGTYEHNRAAAKAGMNKAVLDAAWGTFLRILSDKAESAGRAVIAVNPRHTSQRCAECGHREEKNRKREKFRCLSCGHEAHADVNAAVNILRAGLVLREVHASREAA